jgi:hypothetical protein
MSNEQQYLSKVLQTCLQDFDERLSAEDNGKLVALTEKLKDSPVLEDDLKKLYRVKNMERCALACLWIVDRTRRSPAKDSEFEMDRKLVSAALLEFYLRHGGELKAVPLHQTPVPPVFLKFYESFDTLVLQAKDSIDDPDLYEQMFDHLHEFCEEKLQEMESLNEPGVQIFMDSLVDFLHWVTTRKIRLDARVVQILSETAAGLSEVVGSGVDFNISALEQTTTHLSDAKFILK